MSTVHHIRFKMKTKLWFDALTKLPIITFKVHNITKHDFLYSYKVEIEFC